MKEAVSAWELERLCKMHQNTARMEETYVGKNREGCFEAKGTRTIRYQQRE